MIVRGRFRVTRLASPEDNPEERRQSEYAANAIGCFFTFRIHDS
jgi:hypothetical protein